MEYPNSSQISPEQARYLYEKQCAILILENLPPGSEFGLDLVSNRTGEKFKGVKLIPPGVHFIYACPVDQKDHRRLGPRCGFFHEFRIKEILIKRWSIIEEDFDDSFVPDEDYLSKYSENLRDLDQYLGPYDFSTHKQYLNLTSKLSGKIIEDLMPECKRLRSVAYLTRSSTDTDSNQGDVQSKPPTRVTSNHQPSLETIVPDLRPDPKTVINFTKIQIEHLSADKITKYNLDTTTKLQRTFADQQMRDRLLAEFQFAFITFLLCHIYECFEHWKYILGLVCRADEALTQLPEDFFLEFINILLAQVDFIPEDLFEDIVDSNNLVRNNIDIFLQNIDDCHDISPTLKNLSEELKKNLITKFQWQFGLEYEEDLPVVVEM